MVTATATPADAKHEIHKAQETIDLALTCIEQGSLASASLILDSARTTLREAQALLFQQLSRPESDIEQPKAPFHHNHQLTDIGLDGKPFTVRYGRGCSGCDAEREAGIEQYQAEGR